MKALFDFIPLLLFLIVYRLPPREIEVVGRSFEFGGISSATVVLIVASLLTYSLLWWRQRRLDLGQWTTLLLSLVFGSLTLIFNSETFLKWKAPVIHWAFAIGFYASGHVGDRTPLIRRMMGALVQRHGVLPDRVWNALNRCWVIYFVLGGLLQLYVAFHYPAHWVEFKIFGSMAMSFSLLLAQALFVAAQLRRRAPRGP